jgi:hypothetical protein
MNLWPVRLVPMVPALAIAGCGGRTEASDAGSAEAGDSDHAPISPVDAAIDAG